MRVLEDSRDSTDATRSASFRKTDFTKVMTRESLESSGEKVVISARGRVSFLMSRISRSINLRRLDASNPSTSLRTQARNSFHVHGSLGCLTACLESIDTMELLGVTITLDSFPSRSWDLLGIQKGQKILMPKERRNTKGPKTRTPGVLFTVSTPSKLEQSANGILALFDISFGLTNDDSPQKLSEQYSETVSDAISQELARLSASKPRYRFACELSRGVGFIAFPDDILPSEFVRATLLATLPGIPPLYVSRIIPIDFTCAPNITSFETVMIPHMRSFFESVPDQTWKIVFDKHGLTNLTKERIVEMAQANIPERHEVSIHAPDTVIMVQTTQALCGMSFMRDYDTLCEYNIRKLITTRAGSRENLPS